MSLYLQSVFFQGKPAEGTASPLPSPPPAEVKSDSGEPVSGDSSSDESKDLSITKKGKFLQDSYFTDMLKNFEEAMDEQISKESATKQQQQQTVSESSVSTAESSSARPQFTRMNSYRNVREFAPVAETQAVTLTQDANGYKVWLSYFN